MMGLINIVKKGENPPLPAFSHCPTMFSKAFSLKDIYPENCLVNCLLQ